MQCSGVILAGGKSSRMKFNKAFAPIGKTIVIDMIIEKFFALFDEVIIITNEPELFSNYPVKVHTDIFPYHGPVSGIHAGLSYASNDRIFVQGCDMPFVNPRVVEYMVGKLGHHDAVVPVIKSYLQPTSAVYRNSCLDLLTSCLEKKLLKLTRFFEDWDTLYLDEKELQAFGNLDKMFFNINTIEALERAGILWGEQTD